MREYFETHKFGKKSTKLLTHVLLIMTEYSKQGYRLSLRQLYYQLVARGLIPNTIKSYKKIGALVSNARLAGILDWDMIEDRNRETVIPTHWKGPSEILQVAAKSLTIDMWRRQDYHVECMVEKDALSGVLEPICRRWDVGITANKGYSSSSMMYELGKRIRQHAVDGQQVVVFYLGDHDPSGIDMTRDVEERLKMFSGLDEEMFEVERLALNYDQVLDWKPPENPAKEADARWASYVDKFGKYSWELDAVEPATLGDLLETSITSLIDGETWDMQLARVVAMKADLQAVANEFKTKEY
jgi:hypothetical protein